MEQKISILELMKRQLTSDNTLMYFDLDIDFVCSVLKNPENKTFDIIIFMGCYFYNGRIIEFSEKDKYRSMKGFETKNPPYYYISISSDRKIQVVRTFPREITLSHPSLKVQGYKPNNINYTKNNFYISNGDVYLDEEVYDNVLKTNVKFDTGYLD